ncbi:MAG TPA: APC family permease [Rhizomicrobium sp.]|jgi:APA family basic amino acid/polyamine antiporter
MSAAASASQNHLLRLLGVTFGVAVTVGTMIGSGILRSPNLIAAGVPDTAIILALWVFGAVHAALGANLFAELGTAVPQAGGPYVFAHRAFGDVGGLVVGWAVWISNCAGSAAASASFANFLPLLWPWAGDHQIGVAVAMQAALYIGNVAGLREGRAFQEITSLIKAVMLFVFIVAAICVADPHASAATASHPVAAAFGMAAIVGSYRMIRGAYSGWDAPVFFSEENVSPGATIPKALGIGLLATSILYIGVNAALLYALGPAGVAATPLPFSTVLAKLGGAVPATLFALTAMITVASCANANIMGAPRVIYSLSRDKLLPNIFQRVNTGGSPVFAFALTAVLTLGLAASGTFSTVFALIGTLNTATGVLVTIAFFVLRWREPGLARPFRALGYPVLPALLLIIDLVLFGLFSISDTKGVLFALALAAACVPFAWIAHRARR